MYSEQIDFAYLMKRGREKEARKLVEEENKCYAMTFPAFIDDMLKKYRKSRKKVAEHTGLSQDYLYKVLRGDKKTSERDYILAICIGIGMNTLETDHALTLNGMAGLDNPDKRNYIIRSGILDHRDILAIDDTLEKVGLNPIRVSPDMKKSTIQIAKKDFSAEPEAVSSSGAFSSVAVSSAETVGEHDMAATMPESLNLTGTKYAELSFDYAEEDDDEEPLFTEVERVVKAELTGGLGPFDYDYWAIITVKSRDGRLFYVEGCYGNDYTKFLVLDEENYKLSEKVMGEGAPDNVKVIEEFSSLCEASSSPFFSFYLDIEKATDDKYRETMAMVSDARGKGVRDVSCIRHGEYLTFAELFNEQEPTRLEYFQVRIYGDGRKSFTVSHHSYYMQYYLQELYPLYFGKPDKEEYYFETDDLNSLKGDDRRYRYFFECILDYLRRVYGNGTQQNENPVDEEAAELEAELNELSRRACEAMSGSMSDVISNGKACGTMCGAMSKRQADESEALLLKAEKIIAQLESKGQDMLEEHILNLYKLLSVAVNEADWISYAGQIAALKERLMARLRAGEELDTVAGVMAETLFLLAHGNHGNRPATAEAKAYDEGAMAIIEFIRDKRESVQRTLYQTYVSYSFLIDMDEPEKAVEFLEKATELADELEYAKNPGQLYNVITMHYNRGWVLWHRLGNEEALIYFGYALDLNEKWLTYAGADLPQAAALLEHIGKGVLEFYQETGKPAAAERLKKRLAKSGIRI